MRLFDTQKRSEIIFGASVISIFYVLFIIGLTHVLPFFSTIEGTIQPATIFQEQNNAYAAIIKMPPPHSKAFYTERFFTDMDSDHSGAGRSNMVLWEDDQRLGPEHQLHDTIRAVGGGAYSQWGDNLYFSSSDNSDPRTNGHSYKFRVTPSRELNFLHVVAGWITLLAIGWVSRLQRAVGHIGIYVLSNSSLAVSTVLKRVQSPVTAFIARHAKPSHYIYLAVQFAIYALFAYLAISYLDFGAPGYYFSDELIWVVQDMLERDSLDPQFFNYPAGAHIYLGFFIASAVSIFSPDLAHDQTSLILIMRSISVALFLLTVYLLTQSLSIVLNRSAGILATIVIGSSSALVHHAHIATAQPSSIFMLALTCWATARVCVRPDLRRFWIVAFVAGLAVGAKYSMIALGAALPLLFYWSTRTLYPIKWLVGMAITAAVAGMGTLIFNPFIILNSKTFIKNVLDTAQLEAPYFTSGVPSLPNTFTHFVSAFQAFTPNIAVAFLSIAAVAALCHLLTQSASRSTTIFKIVPMPVAIFGMTLVIWVFSFFIFQTIVNIHQTRYYIPMSVLIIMIFLLIIELSRATLKTSGKAGLPLHRVARSALAVAAIFMGMSAYVHGKASFGASGFNLASSDIKKIVRNTPAASIGLITYSAMYPINLARAKCGPQCRKIELGVPVKDRKLETWDDYLAYIKEQLLSLRVDYIFIDETLFYWSIFIPTQETGDYSSRLRHKNPGSHAWESMLNEAGYEIDKAYPRVAPLGAFESYIGRDYYRSIEGIHGPVRRYRRREDTADGQQ